MKAGLFRFFCSTCRRPLLPPWARFCCFFGVRAGLSLARPTPPTGVSIEAQGVRHPPPYLCSAPTGRSCFPKGLRVVGPINLNPPIIFSVYRSGDVSLLRRRELWPFHHLFIQLASFSYVSIFTLKEMTRFKVHLQNRHSVPCAPSV